MKWFYFLLRCNKLLPESKTDAHILFGFKRIRSTNGLLFARVAFASVDFLNLSQIFVQFGLFYLKYDIS